METQMTTTIAAVTSKIRTTMDGMTSEVTRTMEDVTLTSDQEYGSIDLTMITWLPDVMMCITCLPYAYHLYHQTGETLNRSKLYYLKMVVTSCLAAIFAVAFIKDISSGIRNGITAFHGVTTLILVICLVLVEVERRKHLVTSGVLFTFFLLLVISLASSLTETIVWGDQDSLSHLSLVLVTVRLLLACVAFILFCFAEPVRVEPGDCPELSVSCLQRLSFWWMNRTILDGYRQKLSLGTFWKLRPSETCQKASPPFQKAWQKELHKYQPQDSGESASSGLLGIRVRSSCPSLHRVLLRVYGARLVLAWFLKLICDGLVFLGPALQRLLIRYTEEESEPWWWGVCYAILLFVNSLLYSVIYHQAFHISMSQGVRVKSGLLAAIYNKSLSMSPDSRKSWAAGQLVTMAAVDTAMVQLAFGFFWLIWSSVLQVILSIIMLWLYLGWPILAGLAVLALLMVTNGILAKKQQKQQAAQMKEKTGRIKLLTELLNGMKFLKLYAWEAVYGEKVTEVRNAELSHLKRYAFLSAGNTFATTCATFLVQMITLVVYSLFVGPLDAQTVFVSLSLFNIMRYPLNMIPFFISMLVNVNVSVRRLEKFLQCSDMEKYRGSEPSKGHAIEIENGEFTWSKQAEDGFTLSNVDLEVDTGSLVAVVGQVGTGKSSLLAAILGSIYKQQGRVDIKGSVAYVAQKPWIQNATVRDNILFGRQLHQARYDKVLEACALSSDMDNMPAGDMTMVGQKGDTLSGGQRQRVSLARAAYSEADVIIMDDPLSSVDTRSAKHIYTQLIGPDGLLKDKTRLLVTHDIKWLPSSDQVLVVSQGHISERGSFDELVDRQGEFSKFIQARLQQADQSTISADVNITELRQILSDHLNKSEADAEEQEKQAPSPPRDEKQSPSPPTDGKPQVPDKKRPTGTITKTISSEPVKTSKKPNPFKEERTAVGMVKPSVIWAYVKAMGGVYVVLFLTSFVLYELMSVLANIWLTRWTDDPVLSNHSLSINDSSVYSALRNKYIGFYSALMLIQAVLVVVFCVTFALSTLKASRVLHADILRALLHCPLWLLSDTPSGGILNRFSRDMTEVDTDVPTAISQTLILLFAGASTVIIIGYATPLFWLVIIPIAIVYFFMQRYYIPAARQVKRLSAASGSPIYSHLTESLAGEQTIIAYNTQRSQRDRLYQLVNNNLVFSFASSSCERWLGMRLELLGACTVLAAAMFAVLGREHLSPGLVGLSITYSLKITFTLNWIVRRLSELETNMVSVERITDCSTQLDQERDWQIEKTTPPSDWPNKGGIEMTNYSTRYDATIDPALSNVSVNIKPGEKVGIVGRTGAGKSTLILSLFQVLEASEGGISVDDVDISKLGLHQLRRRLNVLPQESVLFSGNLRQNLDPLREHNDQDIWRALELVQLKDYFKQQPTELYFDCGDIGSTLSTGQRQLVCLARTLLRKSKVLVLDEATASVDLETDELIQATIKQEFSDCTVLTIAHRINTIMDSDRVIVLENGRIEEMGSPQELMDKKGIFYALTL